MDMNFDIVQFSRDLYFYNTYVNLSDQLKFKEQIPLISSILDDFRDAFCNQLHKLFRYSTGEVMDTEEQLFIYTIPRCLWLIDYNQYYFSFMLVAAFIEELVFYLKCKRKCYRFLGSAYKCLVAVFERGFEETFEEQGGFVGLYLFCDRYGDGRYSTKYKSLSEYLTRGDNDHTKYVSKLIKECNVVHNERFELNQYELYLLTTDQQLAIEAQAYDSFAVTDDSTSTDDPELHGPESVVPDGDDSSPDSSFDGPALQPFKKRGKTLLERMCQWCIMTCYDYATYFYIRHRDSFLQRIRLR